MHGCAKNSANIQMKKGIFKSDYEKDREKKMVPPTRNTGDINFSFRSVTQASEGSDLRLTGFESNLSEKKQIRPF